MFVCFRYLRHVCLLDKFIRTIEEFVHRCQEKFFTMKAMRHLLSREAVCAPSLEALKGRLGGPLAGGGHPAHSMGLEPDGLRGSFQPTPCHDSVILV